MMRLLVFICCCITISQQAFTQHMQKPPYTFLALGDSYTIGESLPEQDNFPNQTIQLLRNAGYDFEPPVVLAKTGWTSNELQREISARSLHQYSVVSLLIGVNDQYRGGNPRDYAERLEELIQEAIRFTGKKSNRVFVLSIPDWGVTPFAEGRDRKLISNQIDAFNVINRSIAEKWSVNYIEVTDGTREAAEDPSLIAGDGLHPSAKEYKRWAQKLAAAIQQQIR
jgi:lysophospholipase L1-like esterase